MDSDYGRMKGEQMLAQLRAGEQTRGGRRRPRQRLTQEEAKRLYYAKQHEPKDAEARRSRRTSFFDPQPGRYPADEDRARAAFLDEQRRAGGYSLEDRFGGDALPQFQQQP